MLHLNHVHMQIWKNKKLILDDLEISSCLSHPAAKGYNDDNDCYWTRHLYSCVCSNTINGDTKTSQVIKSCSVFIASSFAVAVSRLLQYKELRWFITSQCLCGSCGHWRTGSPQRSPCWGSYWSGQGAYQETDRVLLFLSGERNNKWFRI